MSNDNNIRHFDSTPHIIRGGHTDDLKNTTTLHFYRSATIFNISIDQSDILGTPFEEQWRQHLAPPDHTGPPGAWVDRWHEFCDLVIGRCLGVLRELAPMKPGREWRTLGDYLGTPKYEISIHRAEGWEAKGKGAGDADTGADVVAIVDSGPNIVPAFSFKPQPMNDYDIPTEIPSFRASELTVIKPKDPRHEPSKILMPDGTVAFLVPAKGPMTRMPQKIVIHPSMTTIRSHLALHNLFVSSDVSRERLACFSDVLGVVTTDVAVDADKETGSEAKPTTTLLAGILLTYHAHARALASPSILSIIAKSSNPDSLRQKWHKALSEAIQTLHSNSDIVHGNINPHCILMCRDNQKSDDSTDDSDTLRPYLKHISQELSNNIFVEPAVRGTKEADLQGLESTFGDQGWLVHEIKKLNGEVEMDSQWHRENAV